MPVPAASASPALAHLPNNTLANAVLVSVTFPALPHASGALSRIFINCAAGNAACAGVPTLAAIASGPPSAFSIACACGAVDASCGEGVCNNAKDVVSAAWSDWCGVNAREERACVAWGVQRMVEGWAEPLMARILERSVRVRSFWRRRSGE